MIEMEKMPEWQEGEEKANAWTHFAGIVLALIGFVVLMMKDEVKSDVFALISYVVFGVSMLILYTMSTLYHGTTDEKYKKPLRYCDHCSIFILIAGSYTPFALTVLRPTLGWYLFGVIWAIALVGIVGKVMFFDKFDKLTIPTYVIMGWVLIFAMKKIIELCKAETVYWLFLGGIAYTSGTFFYARDTQVPFCHAIFHLFVLAGSVGIFFSIYTIY